MKIRLILSLGIFALSGCGMLGEQGVPKEQINSDIADKTIEVQRGNDLSTKTDWNFKEDSYRCFAPVSDETKVTDSNAEMVINLSSIKINSSSYTPVLFGKILLRYKKDNGKWTLQAVEPKDVRTNELASDKFSEYANLQAPLCNYFKYRSPANDK